MADTGSARAVIAAVLGNGTIAVLKLGVFAVSGSGAMLAEGIHSIADTMNQGLLWLGIARSRRDQPGAIALNRIEIAFEHADKIDHRIASGNRPRHRFGTRHIASHEGHLTKIAQRFKPESPLWIATGNPKPRTAGQQFLRQMRAQKATAAKHSDHFALKVLINVCCHELTHSLPCVRRR